MKEKTVEELKKMLDDNENFQLIDVREDYELEICQIGAKHIPMGEVPSRVEEIAKDKPVIIHCRSGKRSGDVVNYLETNSGLTNLYNLQGGILAWIDRIDPSLEKY